MYKYITAMKTKLSVSILLSFVFGLLSSQVPQGFNYQAVARNGSYEIIPNTDIQVMLYIQSASTGGTIFWKELHSTVRTNALGLFTVVVGQGARQTASTVATFDKIDWTLTPKYIKTEILYQGLWRNMGDATQLLSVPYAMAARTIGAGKLNIKGTETDADSALFEVKRSDGKTVFAVYNEGVRVYVEDGLKGSGTRGGFAVGGFDQTKASQPYLEVTPDYTQVYVNENAKKGVRGGFAVGGFDATKAITDNFMTMTPRNYMIGKGTGKAITTGEFNSFYGFEAGYNTTGGMRNSFFGYQSGYLNTLGNDNLFLGFESGYSNISGNLNTFVGYQAGRSNTASYNVLMGYQAGYNNTSGFNNVFIGYLSGLSNTEGDNNVFLGSETGYKTTRGYHNVFIGFKAGHENITGIRNSYVGYQAGYMNDGTQNSFFGYNAGANTTTGSYNLYMGPYAGQGPKEGGSSGSNNVFLGNNSGQLISSGSYNAFLGYKAGLSNTDGNYNVFIGSEAGYSNRDGQYNTFLGYQAGYRNIGGPEVWEGEYNTFLGYQAGYNNTSGYRNIAIGYMAGYGFTSNRYNICIGEQTGTALATGQGNVIIGTYAGEVLSSGEGNVLLGLDAGYGATTATDNVMIGLASGRSANGNGNVFIGKYSGYGETGNNKLVIENNYTGADNASNALIYGDFSSNQLRMNATVGVNAAPGSAKLSVLDDATTMAIRGESSWSGSTSHYGVYGYGSGSTNFNHGVYGGANGGSQAFGVWGTAGGASSYNVGVFGSASGTNPYGVYGTASGTGAYAGYFSGDLAYTGGIYDVSDRNFKKALGKILKINGISYQFRSEAELSLSGSSVGDSEKPSAYNFPDGKQLGVIAQDVEIVLPEIVKTNPDGSKMVDYVKLIPVLLEAVKEQQKMIDQLKAEVEKLKNK